MARTEHPKAEEAGKHAVTFLGSLQALEIVRARMAKEQPKALKKIMGDVRLSDPAAITRQHQSDRRRFGIPVLTHYPQPQSGITVGLALIVPLCEVLESVGHLTISEMRATGIVAINAALASAWSTIELTTAERFGLRSVIDSVESMGEYKSRRPSHNERRQLRADRSNLKYLFFQASHRGQDFADLLAGHPELETVAARYTIARHRRASDPLARISALAVGYLVAQRSGLQKKALRLEGESPVKTPTPLPARSPKFRIAPAPSPELAQTAIEYPGLVRLERALRGTAATWPWPVDPSWARGKLREPTAQTRAKGVRDTIDARFGPRHRRFAKLIHLVDAAAEHQLKPLLSGRPGEPIVTLGQLTGMQRPNLGREASQVKGRLMAAHDELLSRFKQEFPDSNRIDPMPHNETGDPLAYRVGVAALEAGMQFSFEGEGVSVTPVTENTASQPSISFAI